MTSLRAFLCLIGLCLLTGCGSSAATVSGQVTLDGKPVMTPLATGSISFVANSDGSMVQGPLDANGNYKVTIGKETGTKPGTYSVFIVVTEIIQPDPSQPSVVPVPKLLVPERYGSRAQPLLSVEIKNGTNSGVNFDLKSTP